jgi:type III secretory pathway component EscU
MRIVAGFPMLKRRRRRFRRGVRHEAAEAIITVVLVMKPPTWLLAKGEWKVNEMVTETGLSHIGDHFCNSYFAD